MFIFFPMIRRDADIISSPQCKHFLKNKPYFNCGNSSSWADERRLPGRRWGKWERDFTCIFTSVSSFKRCSPVRVQREGLLRAIDNSLMVARLPLPSSFPGFPPPSNPSLLPCLSASPPAPLSLSPAFSSPSLLPSSLPCPNCHIPFLWLPCTCISTNWAS